MTIENFGQLKSAIESRLSRDDLSTADMESSVSVAEARFNRTVRAQEMIEIEGAFAHTARFTNLPAGFLQMERIVLLQGGRRHPVEFATGEQAMLWGNDESSPQSWYSLRGLKFESNKDGVYELSYYKRIDTITGDDTDTNWLLDDYADMYLFASLMEAAIVINDEKRVRMYADRYALAKAEMDKQIYRQRFGNALRGKAL